ncbi:hypothetical protein PV797_04415 [Clostridiaceae bacterium M8S5]|nr:hypothetical protein PV797_04415 [Clostridiaceae bacterium M8S5]
MFAVITSSLFYQQIKRVVYDINGQIAFSKVDTNIDVVETLGHIMNINVKYLIIDLISLGNHRDLPFAIREYRIKNENTQIIVIAPNCYPGNQELSLIVTMGVYDILNPIDDELSNYDIYSDLIDVIDNPTTYSNAVKWDIGLNGISTINSGDSRQKVVTIIKDNIVGTIVIAVAGTMSRIGTTHIAINIASFLKSFDVKVGIVELNSSKVFEQIKKLYIDVKQINNGFMLDGIFFYSKKEKLELLDILQNDFKYLILDLGIYSECQIEEFKRADEKIIVSGVKDWELDPLEEILKANDAIHKNKYIFNFTDYKTFMEIKDNMIDLECYRAPLLGNPFTINNKSYDFNVHLLSNIIPKQDKKKDNIKKAIESFIKRGMKK